MSRQTVLQVATLATHLTACLLKRALEVGIHNGQTVVYGGAAADALALQKLGRRSRKLSAILFDQGNTLYGSTQEKVEAYNAELARITEKGNEILAPYGLTGFPANGPHGYTIRELPREPGAQGGGILPTPVDGFTI